MIRKKDTDDAYDPSNMPIISLADIIFAQKILTKTYQEDSKSSTFQIP